MDLRRIYEVLYGRQTPGATLEEATKRYEASIREINGSKVGIILDAGCGRGDFLEFIKKGDFGNMVGLDISLNSLKLFRAKQKESVKLVNADVRNLPFLNGTFPTTVCFEVLEHIPDWENALNEILRVSKDKLYITTPYKEKIRYIKCPKCNKPTPISFHINTFDEKSFGKWSKDYNLKITLIRASGNVVGYVSKFFKLAANYLPLPHSISQNLDSEVVCINCYEPRPINALWHRTKNRLEKLLLYKPGNLRVEFTPKTTT